MWVCGCPAYCTRCWGEVAPPDWRSPWFLAQNHRYPMCRSTLPISSLCSKGIISAFNVAHASPHQACAVPGKDLHNNTIRILERSLQAAGTDGYADTESGTSSRCAVRVPKGDRSRGERDLTNRSYHVVLQRIMGSMLHIYAAPQIRESSHLCRLSLLNEVHVERTGE